MVESKKRVAKKRVVKKPKSRTAVGKKLKPQISSFLGKKVKIDKPKVPRKRIKVGPPRQESEQPLVSIPSALVPDLSIPAPPKPEFDIALEERKFLRKVGNITEAESFKKAGLLKAFSNMVDSSVVRRFNPTDAGGVIGIMIDILRKGQSVTPDSFKNIQGINNTDFSKFFNIIIKTGQINSVDQILGDILLTLAQAAQSRLVQTNIQLQREQQERVGKDEVLKERLQGTIGLGNSEKIGEGHRQNLSQKSVGRMMKPLIMTRRVAVF